MDAKLIEFDWPQRFETLLEESRHAETDSERESLLRRAGDLLALRDAPVSTITDFFEEAVESQLVEEILDSTYFLFRDPAVWEEVSELFNDRDVTGEPLAMVHLFGLSQPQRAADHLSADSSLEQLVSDSIEAINDWSAVQHRVLSDDTDRGEWYLADVAMAIGEPVKEVDVLRTRRRRESDPDTRARLRVLYRRQKNWRMYIELLKEEVEELGDEQTDAKLDRLESVVETYRDEMDHDMMVVSTYRDILELEPYHLEAIEALIERYEQMGRASDLVEMLERKVELVDDQQTRIELLERIGQLKLDKFHNQPEAIEAYEEILRLAPEHQSAIDFLKQMYEKRRRWSDLVELTERQVGALDETAQKLQALKPVAAKVQRRIPDQATVLWERVLEIEPSDKDAMEALDELYEQTGEYKSLVHILHRRIEQFEDDSMSCELYRRMGRVYANQLNSPPEAIDAWHQALEIEPSDQIQRDLERLYIDLEDWEGLESFYREFRDRKALVRKLETLGGSISDAETKIRLFRRAADILKDELEDPERAEQLLRRVLDVDETQKDVAIELEAYYQEHQKHRKLRDIYEILVEQTSGDEQLEYRQELAELYASNLGNKSRAFSLYRDIFADQPSDSGVRDALFTLAGQQNRWEELEDLLVNQLESDKLDDASRRDIQIGLAQLYVERLSDHERALDILEDVEETEQKIDVLETIYRQQGAYRQLEDVLKRRLSFVSDEMRRAEIFEEIGDLNHEQLEESQGAIDLYRDALEQVPGYSSVFKKLEKLLRQTSQFQALSDLLESEIERLVDLPEERRDTDRIISLHRRLGQLYKDVFDEPETAIEHYSSVLHLEPHTDEVVEQLKGYLGTRRDLSLLAAEGLRPVFRAREDWSQLADLLELILAHADDDETRVDVLMELSSVCEQKLEEWERAADSLKQLLTLEPERLDERDTLFQLAGKTDNWTDLAQFCENLTEQIEKPQLRADYRRKLVRVYDEHLDAQEALESNLRALIELEPDNVEALSRLETLVEKQERFEELAEVKKMQIEALDDPSGETTLRLETGDLVYDKLDDTEQAIELVEPLYDGEQTEPSVFERLETWFRETEQWESLATVLRAQLDSDGIVEHEQKALEYAAILEEHLQQHEAAASVYWNLIEEDPEHEAAFDGLVRIIEGTENKQRAKQLRGLLESTEQWSRLFEVLSSQVQFAPDDEALRLLERMGELATERLNAPQKAFGVKIQMFKTEPAVGFVDELDALAEDANDYQQLGEAMIEAADKLEDRKKGVQLLWRASDLLLDKADAPRMAESALNELRRIEPERTDVLERLEELYRTLQEWKSLADVVEQQLEITDDTDERIDRLNQLGTLYREVIENPDKAVVFYEELLRIVPDELPVARELEDIYQKIESWSKLKDLYERQLQNSSGQRRRELLSKLGDLEENKLERPQRAIPYFESLLDEQPHSQQILERLQALYRKTDSWEQLLDVLERQLDLVSEDEAVAIQFDIAELLRKKLGDSERAFDIYTDILRADTDRLSECEKPLVQLSESRERADRVLALLEPLYRENEQWTELAYLFVHVEDLYDEEGRVSLTSKLSDVRTKRLDQPETAFDDWVRALSDFPTNTGIWDELERLSYESGRFSELLEEWSRLVDELNDGDVRAELSYRMGQLKREGIEDPDGAIESLNRALEYDPGHEDALEALTDIYESTAQWDRLTSVLRQRIEQLSDPDKRIPLELQLATLHREVLDEPERAFHIYANLLEEEPELTEALDALRQMYVLGTNKADIRSYLRGYYAELGEEAELVDLYRKRIDETDDRFELAELWRSIGDLLQNQLDSDEGVVEAYGRAFINEPEDRELYTKFDSRARAKEAFEYLEEAIREAVGIDSLDDEWRTSLLVDLGQLQLGQLENPEDAKQTYQRVLDVNPGNQEALEALADLYAEDEAFDRLAEILEQHISVAEDSELRVTLSLQLGEIAYEKLSDIDLALESYRRVLDHDSSSAEAYRAIEQIYREQEAFEPLSRTLEEHLMVAKDLETQIDLSTRLARLFHRQLDRPEDAIEKWWDVLELDSHNEDALAALKKVYAEKEDWRNLADILERQLDAGVEDALELYELLGDIYWNYLDEADEAIDLWKRALSFEQNYLPGLKALREIFDETNRNEGLAEVLESLIRHPDVDAENKLALRRKLGILYAETLNELDDAAAVWEAVLEGKPEDWEAIEALESIYRRQDRWKRVVDILERKASLVDEQGDEIEIRMEIGRIRLGKLETPEQAIQTYERVLELKPGYLEASFALEDIYRDQGQLDDPESLVDVYLNRAEQLEADDPERQEALENAATLFEETFQQQQRALIVLLSALDPSNLGDTRLRGRIMSLADEIDMYEEAAERYGDILEEAQLDADAADCHREIAYVYLNKLERPSDAVEHFVKVLEFTPEHLNIINDLEATYREIGDWDSQAELLEHHIDVVEDPEQQKQLWRQLGDIHYSHRDASDEAIEAYNQILEIEPADFEAIEALEDIYMAEDRWRDLIDLLDRKVEFTYEPDDILSIRHRQARLWETQIGDIDAAVRVYREALDVDSTYKKALDALERIFEEQERFEELVDVYQKRITATQNPDKQVEFNLEIASIQEEQFGAMDEAISAYKNALMINSENEEAIQNLERIYLDTEQFSELVDIIGHHEEITDNPDKRKNLLNTLAEVYHEELDNPRGSFEACLKSLELEIEQPETLRLGTSVAEQLEEWEKAAAWYEQLADLEGLERQADIQFRLGEILSEKLGDIDGAEQAYRTALYIEDFDHREAFDALCELYDNQGEYEELIDVLKSAASQAETDKRRAGIYARIGKIFEEDIGDDVNAYSYYEDAIEEEPSVIETAGPPLIELYKSEQRWETAIPLLERLIEQTRDSDDVKTANLRDRYIDLAKMYEELEQTDDALVAYRGAYESDSDSLEVLKGLGRLLFERGEYQKAKAIHLKIERDFLADLSNDEVVELRYRLGQIFLELGDDREGLDYLEHALESNAYHRPTLESLIELKERREAFEDVVEYKKRLLDLEEDPVERFAILSDIGDQHRQLDNPREAIHVYREALEIKPDSAVVLSRLLKLYEELEQWIDEIDIIERLIELEDSAEKRSKYHYTIGVLYRDEIGDPKEAIKHFNQSLEENPTHLKPFEAIGRLLTERKAWDDLEKAYRKMLERLSDDPEGKHKKIRSTLWENLGEIYRSRLEDFDAAMEAFETAVKLGKDTEKLHLILAELYERTGKNTEGMIRHHRALLKHDPFEIDSYKALFKAYLNAERHDEAWCMASALNFLDKADEKERKFYLEFKPENLRQPNRTLEKEGLQRLYHSDIDTQVSSVMNILGQGLRDFYSQDLRAWDIDPNEDQLDIDSDILFCRIFKTTANQLRVTPPPEVYLNRKKPIGLKNANGSSPSVVVGADIVQGKQERALAFTIAHQLCWMRPEYYLGSIGYPTEFLKLLFMSVMHLTKPELGIEDRLGNKGEQVLEEIRSMPGHMKTRLTKRMGDFLEKGKNPNLTAWKRYVEFTANRAGFLYVGDLADAVHYMKNEVDPIGKASLKDKIKDLVLFSVSQEYFELRRELGLTIKD